MSGLAGRVVRAVTVDLDDTLFPQRDYLTGAWRMVAAAAAAQGRDGTALLNALTDIAAQGTDSGGIIDRALERCGIEARQDLVAGLVTAFRGYRPAELSLYPGARDSLRSLREVVPVACVTDGDPQVQQAKIAALGLADAFDAIVISDETGRQFRKPHAVPFLLALHRLGALAANAVHVGDRLEKDVTGPHQLGMAAIRVRTGEYAGVPDASTGAAAPDLSFDDVAAAFRFLREAVLASGLPSRAGAL